MPTIGDKIRQFYKEKETIKSKVMFSGKYRDELEKLMEMLENMIEKEIVTKYEVISISYGNNYFKVRLKNSEEGIEKLLNCALKYTKNDERYGYINPEIGVHQFSKKTVIHEIGKFHIMDKENILKLFLNNLIKIIEDL
ncbi:MAG: hypothetical protein PHR68_01580 [Candidatus Gracilibacteria bacterium]|nr:hypothetical protein [Candidatus Gracilibacteria bacterium]